MSGSQTFFAKASCDAAAQTAIGAAPASVLVIDNASGDTSLESVEGFRNRVNFVRNSVNRGFAAAVNRTVHLAPGGNFADGFALSATTPGNAALKLELSGPGDLKIARQEVSPAD